MRVVAISRQVGSFGDEIGSLVAGKAGLAYIGRDEVHAMAQACDPEYSDACSLYESEHGPGFLERIFFDRPTYMSLFEALTYEQAARGDVVITGRGSQVVLRDVPGVLRVRVVAPTDIRVHRIMTRRNIERDDAESFVRRYDRERRNLIHSVFGVDPKDWGLYDLIVNTAKFTAHGAADVVVRALDNMERVSDSEALRDRLRNLATAKRLETVVRKRLTAAVARGVEIAVEPGGLARITGRVAEKREKSKVEEIVSKYPGVTKVQNELKVTQLAF